MTRALVLALGFFAGCVTDAVHNDFELRERVEILEHRFSDENLFSALAHDFRMQKLEGDTQRLQWLHPENEEWGPLK